MQMQPRIHAAHPGILRDDVPAGAGVLWVDVSRQRAGGWIGGQDLAPAPISTSRHGLGNQPDSGATPLGWHRVVEVIGKRGPLGQAFVSRRPVGAPLPPAAWREGDDDRILSRILRLQGCVPALNGNSFERFIYLHGTNREDRLGRPASAGCIRMANGVIADWADRLDEDNTWVWIGNLDRIDA